MILIIIRIQLLEHIGVDSQNDTELVQINPYFGDNGDNCGCVISINLLFNRL